ncbi:Ig-like domain-containing protein [Pelagicoccus enzymogenes]|uniref:Ig-like domain-containing protein n=1 Tax=Pelagicoccus enzymogenes TaxID=2773457 RepID=UPI00280D929B|nr:Ig-like domain-containing protein [Pelagicoccus enzymogenes]MDQ8201109.1 Ig-like domain-containing protein [Pelagicoccus enzymogenes]
MPSPHHATYHGTSPKPSRRRFLWKRALAACVFSWGMASMEAGQLSLTWQDNSDNEDGFEIERSLMGQSFGLLATVEADAESFVDASIIPGREYEYRVRAFNAFGYSGYTNVSVGMMPNSAPVVGAIEDVSLLQGEQVPEIAFSFSDKESPVGELVVEALSSNLALLPLTGLSVEMGEGVGTVSLAPNAAATGTANITLLISDGVEVAQRSFSLEVLPNAAPTIGSLQEVNVFDGKTVGPIAFSIADREYDASLLTVTGKSMNESLIASESISFTGTGSSRKVSFATLSSASGSTTLRLTVSDGVNSTTAALRVNVTKNAAPVISGLESSYTIDGDGELSGLAFTVTDAETSSSSLQVSVRSSNSLLVSQHGLKLTGSGNQRALSATPLPGMTGTVVITVAVSDGVHTTEESFNLRVLAPEQIVKVLDFTIENRLAVIEVENRSGATFSLWKIHSLDGAWEKVEAVETVPGETSTTLIDPTPIDSPVCYRVIASE